MALLLTPSTFLHLSLLLPLLPAPAAPPVQAGETVVKKAAAAFKERFKAHNPNTRVAAVKGLMDADSAEGAELLVKALEDDDLVIRAAALEMLKGYRSPGSLQVLLKALGSRKSRVRAWSAVALGYRAGAKGTEREQIREVLHVLLEKEKKTEARAGVLRALGRLGDKEAGPWIVPYLKERSPAVRMEAAYALGRIRPEGAVSLLVGLLDDPAWPVQVQAARSLFRLKDPRTVPALLRRLPRARGRVKEDLLKGLTALTGRDFGLEFDRWEEWWDTEGKAFVKSFDPSREYKAPPRRRYAEGISYYRIRTFSRRLLFVLDVSGSMLEEFLPAKSYGYGLKQIPRIEVAKKELVKLIRNMEPDTFFNMVYFASHTQAWKDKLMAATARNKKEAVKFVERYEVKARGPETLTNLYEALDLVFTRAEKELPKHGGEVIADTVFLLSDGVPYGPEWLTDRDAIVWAVRERNRHLKLKIHTISLAGDMETPRFLTRLSKPSGGEMKNVLVD